MNTSDMFLFHERSSLDSLALGDGPRSPRRQDPGPEGGEAEPVGDDENGAGVDEDEEPETRRIPPAAPREAGREVPASPTPEGPEVSSMHLRMFAWR